MMTNLFSPFDPATPSFLTSNWPLLLIFTLTNQVNKYCSSYLFAQPLMSKSLKHYLGLAKTFSNLIKTSPNMSLFGVMLFVAIAFFNLFSLLPFVFSTTTQLSCTLALSLPMWLAANIYGWSINTSNLLSHQIPQSTPWLLMPVMVVIELISNLIRPITLTVRLTANLMAGHILLSILMTASLSIPPAALPFIIPIQFCFIILELLVSYIQAYVFATLTTIYANEMAS